MSTVAAPAVEDANKHWAPHGAVLTAFVVGINLLMVLLVFFYFWRFFSGKRGPPPSSSSMAGGADDEEAASSDSDTSPAASPRVSWRRLREWPAGRRQQEEDIASSLPVSVYSSADVGNGKAAAECAVCIVEFRDGDLARLLPRCGHRFHADCVGAWLRLHSTCPLCRAAALPLAASTATASVPNNNDDPKDDAAAHCPWHMHACAVDRNEMTLEALQLLGLVVRPDKLRRWEKAYRRASFSTSGTRGGSSRISFIAAVGGRREEVGCQEEDEQEPHGSDLIGERVKRYALKAQLANSAWPIRHQLFGYSALGIGLDTRRWGWLTAIEGLRRRRRGASGHEVRRAHGATTAA
ncbi:uncharacterized protein [Oryza sativa Japonica Group]|uniref:uncharacterized protein n=1 Tax=Oryza sativa subsp. japonica TaxID=39947 RepID=UPI0001C7D51E|nr:putative RING-H2 finger protein [Oryza sativa Japonica Group]